MSKMNIITGEGTDRREIPITFRMGSESDKDRILVQYPYTKQVLNSGGYLIVAETEDEIIGFLWAFKRKIPAPVEQNELFINVIETFRADLRCRGIASEMIRELLLIAKEEKIYQIRAYCDIGNVPSHRLWLKNGFTISPVKLQDGTIPGSFVSLICKYNTAAAPRS